MAAPVVTYWDSDTGKQVTNWKIGEVDAGAESPHTIFNIWNNKGGTSAVSTMKNVTLHILNKDGSESNTSLTPGNTMVTGKWTRVKVNGGAATQIGGSANVSLRAKGLSSGSNIEGAKSGDTKNYAQVEAYVVVPSGAAEGTYEFIMRTKYQYT